MIAHCGICKSGPAADYQDKTYGQGNRVFNLCAKAEKSGQEARCTVCGKTMQVKGGEGDKK